MINLNGTFPSNSNSPDGNYPYGSARNVTTSGDNTGTPFVANLQNDIIGLQQFLITEAGITPNNVSDNAVTSQQFEAIWKILNTRTFTKNISVDSDYTLTAKENLKNRIIITDTSVILTTTRNIIVDAVPRELIVKNSTAQSLVFKTTLGTGITVLTGETKLLYVDGTNVVLSDIYDSISTTGTLDVDSFLHIQDQKPSGTNAGSSIAGTQIRDLNTILTNTISGASLSSNQITLPIGKYYIEASAPAYANVGNTKVILRNDTDAQDILIGESQRTTTTVSNLTKLSGVFEIASTKDFTLRQYTTNAVASYGLGYGAITDGNIEIYSEVKIWKVG